MALGLKQDKKRGELVTFHSTMNNTIQPVPSQQREIGNTLGTHASYNQILNISIAKSELFLNSHTDSHTLP